MTRPKVEPDKRQRTACACDSCKRRKQKCDGKLPCNTCTKRQLPCSYKNANQEAALSAALESPAKRRQVDNSPKTLRSSPDDTKIEETTSIVPQSHLPPVTQWNTSSDAPPPPPPPALAISLLPGVDSIKGGGPPPAGSVRHILNGPEVDSDSRSRMSNASGNAEEAEVMPSQRMLQDSTGRLLYVGDSATLSYLQLIRMMVENIAGPSDFTMDPRRHMIMEAAISPLPPFAAATSQLPDPRTARVLVNSFFTNTSGFIEVFDRRSFEESIDEAYSNPLTIDHSLLCLLFLVLAIGLVLAQPEPGSSDEIVINKLREDKTNRAAIFFMKAKALADPVSGFEDADFWSVQALLLMSLYMLSVSKRNASYAYFGMAVRSAFALGLHREESMEVFQRIERNVRRNVWRSLFVLDRFLAASLGRPTAISEDDCSDHALDPPGLPIKSPNTPEVPRETGRINLDALDSSIGMCRIMGTTLKKVYSKRKISTSVAQEMANQLQIWYDGLPEKLHWRQLIRERLGPSHGIAVLHVNLLYCHCVILLTRPFFLYILSKAFRGPGAKAADNHGTQVKSMSSRKSPRLSQKMEKFAQTCIEAAQHTLVLAQAAHDCHHVPQSNPFIIHFVFAAGLVILSNEFANLYHNPDAESAIRSCSTILKYCGERDAQADRVSWIVDKFHAANQARPAQNRDMCLPGRITPVMKSFSQTYPYDSSYDPMADFFSRDKGSRQNQQAPTVPSMASRKHSIISSGMTHPMLPSGLQQPSPEGSGASPVQSGGSSVSVVAGVHDMETMMGGAEEEIPFDSYWPQSPWQNPPISLSHPVEYGEPYGISQPQISINTMLANGHVPLYPATDFH